MSLTDDLGGPREAMLLQRARTGDGPAFGALYEQHLSAARRLARSLVADRSDADDVVAEVFAATFVAMRRGLGPADDFRSYVLRSVRRECQRTWRRGARQHPGGEVVVDLAAARATGRNDFDWLDEGDVVQRALSALPPRLQHVLWLTEIEGLSHEEVASRLDTSSVNVAQLARRARLEFGEHYLDAHLPATDGPVPAACARPRQVLAEVVRGTASRRTERMAADHLATCPACAGASAELEVVNERLRTGHIMALLPALDLSRPVTVGLVTKLVAWIGGTASTMSAVATLALATAIAPEPVEPVVEVAPAAAAETVIAPGSIDTAASPIVAVGAEPSGEPSGAVAADVVPADPATVVPTVVGAASGVATAAAGVVPSNGGVIPFDEQLTAAVEPILGALPTITFEGELGPVPIGPVATPTLGLGVEVADGEIETEVVAGDATVEVGVGGVGAPSIDVPPLDGVVDALPIPQPPALPILPLG